MNIFSDKLHEKEGTKELEKYKSVESCFGMKRKYRYTKKRHKKLEATRFNVEWMKWHKVHIKIYITKKKAHDNIIIYKYIYI